MSAPARARFTEFRGGDVITVKASAESTGGAYSLFETRTPPGAGAPPRVHAREDEAFYVLSGTFEFHVGGERIVAAQGTYLHGPQGIPHWFRNIDSQDGRLLVFIQPGGFEKFIAEFAELPLERPLDRARMQDLGRRHGLEFLAAE